MSKRTQTKTVTTLLKHSITFWSLIRRPWAALKMTTMVIVALIPNIMMMITLLAPYRLTVSTLSNERCNTANIMPLRLRP